MSLNKRQRRRRREQREAEKLEQDVPEFVRQLQRASVPIQNLTHIEIDGQPLIQVESPEGDVMFFPDPTRQSENSSQHDKKTC